MGKKKEHMRAGEWIEATHPGEWIEAAQRWCELQKETGHPPPGHPYEAILEWIAWEKNKFISDLPTGAKLVNEAASCWRSFPIEWWRIKNMPATGYLLKHDGLKPVKVNESYLIGELRNLQYCAASLLSRAAELFRIDGSPILSSTRICWRHFKTKSSFLREAHEYDQTKSGWPDCIEHDTTLTMPEQREAFYGDDIVDRILDAVNHPDLDEETFTLPDGNWANKIILPAEAESNGDGTTGAAKKPPSPTQKKLAEFIEKSGPRMRPFLAFLFDSGNLPTRKIGETVKHVYGSDDDNEREKLIDRKKDANQQLAKQDLNFQVTIKGGSIWLEEIGGKNRDNDPL
jgi:hypothetical protein